MSAGFTSAFEVIQVADGGYIFTGRTENDEPYLLKVDALGNVVWFQQYNIGGWYAELIETSQQEIIIGGSNANGELSIIKTDATIKTIVHFNILLISTSCSCHNYDEIYYANSNSNPKTYHRPFFSIC